MDDFSLARDRSRDHRQGDGRYSVCGGWVFPFLMFHFPISLPKPMAQHYQNFFPPLFLQGFFIFLQLRKWRSIFPVPELYTRLLNHPQVSFSRPNLRKYLLKKITWWTAPVDDLKQGPSSSQEVFLQSVKTVCQDGKYTPGTDGLI